MRRIAKYIHRTLNPSVKIRSEQEIFDELASLCTFPGYIHAIAAICFRDNILSVAGKLSSEDILNFSSKSRLIRTETTTLIGLMMRAPIDFTLPKRKVIYEYIEQTETLLEELHQAIQHVMEKSIFSERITEPGFNPFQLGEVLREPIFYGPESAYIFQYRDLALRKYYKDSDWLLHNKGLDLVIGREVCVGILELMKERIINILSTLKPKLMSDLNMLSGFTFSCHELAIRISRSETSVRAIIEAFTIPKDERNVTFNSLHDFNTAYAYPFIRKGPDEFIMLQSYGVSEALYETPFYWMCNDKSYVSTALRHRGEFTEEFVAERLTHVFGADKVFQNVEIFKSNGKILGEIDVLVVFGDRAIVLQAKSKKLTQESRKGNDLRLQSDFRKAVQESVDQAFNCAKWLEDLSVTLRCRSGQIVTLAEPPSTTFLISVVADHYPALFIQAREFLQVNHNDRISQPLVLDVFALDSITEMLDTPLRLLNYLRFRTRLGDKVIASHEHTLLAYHLEKNWWPENDFNLISITDEVSAGLDVAMAVRREGIPGESVPDGILTRFQGTLFAKIITDIEHSPNRVAIDLGLMLLQMSENVVWDINGHINHILTKTKSDTRCHYDTLIIPSISCGLTLHCSIFGDKKTEVRLGSYCIIQKYLQKADKWFGVALLQDGSIHLVIKLNNPWKFDKDMETMLAEWPIRVNSD